jgi:peptidoglycan/xylan/chitin deacetylase (PgdA/CDA1 family)
MLLEIGIGLPAAAALVVGYGARGRSSRLFGPNIWHGPRDQKMLALTFDDGPSEWTPHVLEILDPLSVHATFFQCGSNVARLPKSATTPTRTRA